ncbi:hypothetical protein P8452_46772 [Trifolium repens]|nr:hypothetical protein P8452_46772 [Trifolium repens]
MRFCWLLFVVLDMDAARDCCHGMMLGTLQPFRMRRGQKAILDFPLQSEANPKPNNNGRKRRIHQRGMS